MSVREAFQEAEELLRCEFEPEKFKIGRQFVDGRTTGGDLGIDFDDDGAKSGNTTARVVFFKHDFPGKPVEGKKIIWCAECGEIKMMIEGVRGMARTSPTWHIDLREV